MSSRKLSAVHLHSCLATIVLMCGICFSVPAGAQVAGGNLSGTITDPSGKLVPQAQISIQNVATGITTTVATNADGYYTAANLLPGEYQITVSAKGFATEVKKGVSLSVGAQQVVDLTLQIGSAAKTVVEVTTEAPAVQLTSSDISAVVNATTVRELPLNGRSWTDLAALQPGVDTIQTQPTFAVGADRGNRGFGQQLTISGARPQQNNYRLDGVSLNDYANGAPGSVLGGNLGVDAIQEFSVLTSNYSAEYGKTSGGVVNAITRSGTNGFHGSAYEFLRNSKLDARNFFEDPTQSKAPFKRNQFGGAIGGPIIKNRTFFFADFEAIRQSKGIAVVDVVPSNAARGGLLCSNPSGADPSSPCTTTQLPAGANTDANGVDLKAKAYFPLYPVPNGAILGNGDTALFTFSGQQVVNENFVTTRVDHRFSSKDSIFGTYLFDRTPYSAPDGMNNVELGSLSSRQIVAAEETHSFTPVFVNALRFGFNHEAVNNNQSLKAINPKATDGSLASFAGRNAAQVQISGTSLLPGGVGGLPTYLYDWNSFQVYDDAFLNRGRHTIKFGVAVERMLMQATALTDPSGIWQFADVGSFLTNSPSRFQGGIVSTLSPRDVRQTIFGTYLQDDWRWVPNLTLNLGLRYEMATVPTEIHGKLANLRHLTDANPHLGDPFFVSNPTTKNFEPRIGFAWDPFRNGKMAVRGGAGLFDVLPLPYQFILLVTQAAPFFEYTSIKNPGAGTFFDGVLPPFPANKLRQTYTDPSPKRNYVTQWNLNVQYQLTPSLAAMVAYVGSRGVHQPFRVDDADTALPTLTSAGYVWDPNASRLNDNYGSIRGMFYQGRSYFNALELQLAKRMSHGFQLQGTFTWGKSIDTSSATVAGDAFGNSISSLNWFDMRLDRGLSDFNIGRTLVVNGTWDIPTAKSFSGPAKWISDGWELGLILTISDGVPFTPTWGTGDDPALTQNNDDWAFPNRLGGPGCRTLTNPGNVNNYIKTQCFAIPTAPDAAFFTANNCQGGDLTNLQCFNLRGNAGRNILIGPGITNLDFSVFKNNRIKRISENFNVQFRAEIFNILNHPNFAPPTVPDNSDIFLSDGSLSGAAGLLTRTTIPERQIQFAIKFIF
ncbi:MAG TPA: TonB-dependent receptor [Candidatus Sulfotelmatobacter sp.]|nr:TonB-dependent receptor [Candidatus Sulfotelmatobacter sp.]